MDIAKQISDLGHWSEPYTFGGVKVVDDERFAKVEARMRGRHSIFLDPPIRSCGLAGKRVLDLGSRAGYWSKMALDGGASFVRGVETSEQRIAQAAFAFQQIGIDRERYDFVRADVYEALSAMPREYDIVLCLGLFYHIEEPMRLVRLMQRVAKEIAIIDTSVHDVPTATISVRPTARHKHYLDASNVGLEFVSSPKAVHWMCYEAGFKEVATLKFTGESNPQMQGYRRGVRRAFVAAQEGVRIAELYDNIDSVTTYVTPEQDRKLYGRFPERRGIVRPDEGDADRTQLPSRHQRVDHQG